MTNTQCGFECGPGGLRSQTLPKLSKHYYTTHLSKKASLSVVLRPHSTLIEHHLVSYCGIGFQATWSNFCQAIAQPIGHKQSRMKLLEPPYGCQLLLVKKQGAQGTQLRRATTAALAVWRGARGLISSTSDTPSWSAGRVPGAAALARHTRCYQLHNQQEAGPICAARCPRAAQEGAHLLRAEAEADAQQQVLHATWPPIPQASVQGVSPVATGAEWQHLCSCKKASQEQHSC